MNFQSVARLYQDGQWDMFKQYWRLLYPAGSVGPASAVNQGVESKFSDIIGKPALVDSITKEAETDEEIVEELIEDGTLVIP